MNFIKMIVYINKDYIDISSFHLTVKENV